ncbi:metal-dependent hydrolase [Halosimplex rubrum]|uniref:Metal-dependent hydrolase n=1 Tax=Halosimplex rubrum TaxID=869889 RepID=A0A7D5P313_9EURY|nr:metal-dependent hydrolase [Halosimplex rubrum]QLH76864.1 metal-dependent hydrolase [Halosimplex rubrum]
MWPWGHLAVAYLSYVAIVRLRGHRQRLWPLVAVAVGSQLPDLVDKPLAWTFAVLPSGRTLMHSFFAALVMVTVTYWVSRRIQRQEVTVGLGVGMVSHSLVDLGPGVVFGLLQGQWDQLQWTTYLLWPLLAAPPYPNDSSFMEHLTTFTLNSYLIFQFGLLVVAVVVWLRSDTLGLKTIRRSIR